MIIWYDREGRPLDTESASRLLMDPEYKRIVLTTIGPYVVSTVWLGNDYNFSGEGPPVIFETMVFALDPDSDTLGFDLDCRRYCTEEEARVGHEETLLLIRATLQEDPHEVSDDTERESEHSGD